jgi:hypothetical protein
MAYTTIKKPSDYFITKLYSGNGSTQNITGLDFQPDWVWIKERTSTSDNMLFDAVRGATNRLESNTTDSEGSSATQLNAFNSDGWTTGSSAGTNESGQTYASWNWLGANGTASNTDGSITSTVSANTTSGFSIVSYTGTGSNATVGHGLGVTPAMIIFKNRSGSYNWPVLHHKLSGSGLYNLLLNSTNAEANYASALFNSTSPTSSVFNVGTSTDLNASGENIIAYCFAEVKGFSKFGSYTGNGSTDGTFVYTGFKPAFVMGKATSGTENWFMNDNKRLGYNDKNYRLYPNLSNSEATDSNMEILSNGFKLNTANGNSNGVGITYIYMAFAEEPLVGDNPATAR